MLLFDSFAKFSSILERLGHLPPVVILLTIHGVKDLMVESGDFLRDSDAPRIRKNTLLLPEVTVQDFSEGPRDVLLPIFDILWSAGGLDGSPNFSTDGN
jgi:hypothetical protein